MELACTPAATWTLAIAFMLIGIGVGAFVVGWLRREKYAQKIAVAEQLTRVRIRNQFDSLCQELDELAVDWPTIAMSEPAWKPPLYGRAFN